ncbi:hypothetical protein HanPI659440_Chr05g0207981 [Helianthus annuus]|nr:hypothetical protein HanPI659440_Chr05g0207981 [Helianthus annuus]
MSGALAWQVKSVNEMVVFWFLEGDGTGLLGSPSMCARVSLSLLSLFSLSLSLYTTHHSRSSISKNV